MINILNRIERDFDNWSKYRRTVNEIERMPLDVALDLDIYKGDAKVIAHRAVYGA